MATISTNQNLESVSYAAGELITITNGARLTITVSPSVPPGSIFCNDGLGGGLDIINTSTTTPLHLKLNSEVNDILIQDGASLNIQGDWINVGTGNGTGLTLDFSTLLGGNYPYPAFLRVETGNGTGVYENYPVVRTDSTYTIRPTDYGGTHRINKLCFLNTATKQITFTNGTAGVEPASGANIQVPNILIDSLGYSTSTAGRSAVTVARSTPGTFDKCAFSYRIILSQAAGHGNINYTNVGLTNMGTTGSGTSDISFTRCIVNLDGDSANQVLRIQSTTGRVDIDELIVFSYNNSPLDFRSVSKLGTLRNIYTHLTGTAMTRVSIQFQDAQMINPEIPIENVFLSNGVISLNDCNNIYIKNYKYSVPVGAQSVYRLGFFGSTRNVLVHTIDELEGMPAENCISYPAPLGTGFGQDNNAIHNAFFRFNGASTVNGLLNGFENKVSNIRHLGNTTGDYIGNNSTAFGHYMSRYDNGGNGFRLKPMPGFHGEYLKFTQYFEEIITGTDYNGFITHVDSADSPTAGQLWIGGFYNDVIQTGRFDFGAQVEGTDYFLSSFGRIYLKTAGSYMKTYNYYPVRGVVSFTSDIVHSGGSGQTNFTYEFRLKNAGDADTEYTTLRTITNANLTTSLGELAGYDSKIGLDFEIVITHPTGSETNNVQSFYIGFNPDTSYTPPVGRINMIGERQKPGSTMYIIDKTTGAVLNKEPETSRTSASYVWHDFDLAKPVVLRSRQLGYTTAQAERGVVYLESKADLETSEQFATISANPGYGADFTITNHGASPVTWEGKEFSITIQLVNDSLTPAQLQQQISWETNTSKLWNGFAGVCWPDILNLEATETRRGQLVGSLGAELKGIRVVRSDGSSPAIGFTRFQSDDGTYAIAPVLVAMSITGWISGATVVIHDEDSADPQSLGTELQRSTNVTSNVTYAYDGTKIGDLISISHYAPGYRVFQQKVTLGPGNSIFEIIPQIESN